MALVHRPGLLAALRPVLVVPLASALTAGCGGDPDRARETAVAETIADTMARDTLSAPAARSVDADTMLPPVPDGEPMPAAEVAAGIPPYPGATVWMADRGPASTYRVNAFTPDPWHRVAAYYEEALPGWRVIRAPDMVVFQKEPDQAAVTVSPWDFWSLPADAPEPLRRARTAIGAAWR